MGKLRQPPPLSPFTLTFSRYGDIPESDYNDMRRNLAISPTKKVQVKPLRPLTPSSGFGMSATLEAQAPFALFLLPLYSAMRSFGFIDFQLIFDPVTQNYVYVPGSRLRKICSLVLGALFIFFVYMECEYQQYVKRQAGLTSLMAMMKIIQVCYVSLRLCFFYIMHTRGPLFPEILNRMQRVSAVLEGAGCGLSRKASSTMFSRGLLISMLTYGVFYVLDPFIGAWLYDSQSPGIIEACADTMVKSLVVTASSFGYHVPREWLQYKIYEDQPYWVVVAAAAVKVVSHYLFCIVWVFAVMLVILWALAFSHIFRSFVNTMAQRPSRSTLQDLRKFNLIIGVLDKFNEAMGPLTFIACLTCITHFSIHIQYLVDFKIWWYGKFNVAIGLAYFSGMLIAGSNVNQEASRMIEVVRLRYQDMHVWHKYHGTCAETTQGLLLLLADIQTNNIGFKGLKFFTISYSFIGTVLSVISTYAMVVLQIKNKTAD